MSNSSSKSRSTVIFVLAIIAAIVVAISLVVYFSSDKGDSPTPAQTAEPTSQSQAPTDTPAPAPSVGTDTGTGLTVDDIQTQLSELSVIETVNNDGYERDLFGGGWLDTDDNGCDTRNDILLRDLTDVTIDGDGCRILSGVLNDSYTGTVIDFTRGQDSSLAVQIDHLVPLSRAWALGASGWDANTREAFANDPANLFAVEGAANNNKSDQGFENWTPAIYSCIDGKKDAGQSTKEAKAFCLNENVYSGTYYDDFDCEYAARYVMISSKYKLAVTASDVDRIESALTTCA